MRLLTLAVVLLCGLAGPASATFCGFAASYGAANCWLLSADPNDSIGGNNGTVTGTITYGLMTAPGLIGAKPATSTDVITVTQAFTSPNSWTAAVTLAGTGSAQQVPFVAASALTPGATFFDLNDSACGTGQMAYVVRNSSAFAVACSTSSSLNDGAGHALFAKCWANNPGASGDCNFYVDGLYNTSVAWSFSAGASVAYQLLNFTSGPAPVLGSAGGVAYWSHALDDRDIATLSGCVLAGGPSCSAPLPPADTCPPTGMTVNFCENWDTYQSGFGYQLGGCGSSSGCSSPSLDSNSNTGTFAGAIVGTALTITGSITGTCTAGMWLYDRPGGVSTGGNINLQLRTLLMSGAGSSWTVSPSQTVTAENMGCGYWTPETYTHQEQYFTMPAAAVVGENGGSADAPGQTYRHLDTAMTVGSEHFFRLQFWAEDQTCGGCGWSVPGWGWFDQNLTPDGFVKFGNNNSPPTGFTNLQLGAGGNVCGNVNVRFQQWHDIVIDIDRETSASGHCNLWVDGLLVISFVGVTAQSTNAMQYVGLVGAAVTASPPAEGYFDRLEETIGHFNGSTTAGRLVN